MNRIITEKEAWQECNNVIDNMFCKCTHKRLIESYEDCDICGDCGKIFTEESEKK